MLKQTDNYEDQTHFSYRDYKRKNRKGNKDVTIFISVFVIGVLIILGFVKILSPNVDVGIGGNEEYEQIADDNDNNSGSIDARLKTLKMADENGVSGSDKAEENTEIFSPEFDEKVKLPKQVNKPSEEDIEPAAKSTIEEKPVVNKDSKAVTNQPSAHEKQEIPGNSVKAPVNVPVPPTVNAKVVVGYYETEKQAEVAKSIIHDAGLGVNPIVKDMNGYYTLQVGAYSSKEKAQQVANSLIKSNYPARVIVE